MSEKVTQSRIYDIFFPLRGAKGVGLATRGPLRGGARATRVGGATHRREAVPVVRSYL